MTLIIETKLVRQHGLDTYHVLVNGTLLNTFMSKEAAETKRQQLVWAWENELSKSLVAKKKGVAA